MPVDNDSRGWIMTCVSGTACVLGSSIICVDLLVQKFPSKRNFRIQESNSFLASSLSLSFGVMLFSSLYSMLPSAQQYLDRGGLRPNAAAFTTICCFLGGVAVIQFLSRILHHYIPSHIVDCDHSHSEGDNRPDVAHYHHNSHDIKQHGCVSESTPLIQCTDTDYKSPQQKTLQSPNLETAERHDARSLAVSPSLKRPTFQKRLTSRVSTFVSGAKASCDEGGPCYGYSEPCGQECLKALNRNPTLISPRTFGRLSTPGPIRQPSLLRTASTPYAYSKSDRAYDGDEEIGKIDQKSIGIQRPVPNRAFASGVLSPNRSAHASTQLMVAMRPPDETEEEYDGEDDQKSIQSNQSTNANYDCSHHHHVPSNAFMAIGVQTSIAIALHKLPEGFITYATNHVNPSLGFTVFMALFIHNITEGFAMALPLYLAIDSRGRAILISSVLGGVSQPFGAGIAALWFLIAGSGSAAPGDVVYGCMFSVTAGIMTSVALQLFSESLALNHSQGLCTIFAFAGMGILGISFALTA